MLDTLSRQTLPYAVDRNYASSAPLATLLCLACFMQPGTGGLSSLDYIKARGGIGYPLIRGEYSASSPVEDGRPAGNTARTPTENLAHIRAFLRPSMSDLAAMLGVSRQALYDWQAGKAVAAENASRLVSLASAVDTLVEEGLSPSAQIVRRAIQPGRTLLDIVREGGDAVEAARILVGILKREAAQRDMLSARLSSRARRTTTGEEFGLPVLDEAAPTAS